MRLAAVSTPGLTAGDLTSFHSADSMGFLARDHFIRIPVVPETATASSQVAPATPASSASVVAAASQPSARQAIVDYTVVAGDTVGSIAARYGVTMTSVLASNGLSDSDVIVPGRRLVIPPVNGIVHTVVSGDTLSTIADRYGVSTSAVLNYLPNGLTSADQIRIGQRLMIPGGTAPAPARVAAPADRGTTRTTPQAAQSAASTAARPAAAAAPAQSAPVAGTGFVWPTRGPIFTYFSGYHPGLDISPPFGTPIYATQGGTVVNLQRLNYSYGWYLDIDHGNGYMSRYAHVSAFMVGIGSTVRQGQHIANVGSTGNSTGPHVHFEIYRNGVPVNPLSLLQ